MDKILINKIIELKELLKEQIEVNETMKDSIYKNFRKELISIIFSSTDKKINHSLICKKDDNFKVIENLLYESYPEYKQTENLFMVKGNKIDKNKTIKENNIKDNDIIVIVINSESKK